jgi:hypothetical protein
MQHCGPLAAMNPREMQPLRLSDERVIECLLEMFRVHQQHARRLHFQPGLHQ